MPQKKNSARRSASAEYQPPQKVLENYARVLVNFALGGGRGIKKGDVVIIQAPEIARPLYIELLKAVWRAGGHVIERYQLDAGTIEKDFFNLSADHQIEYFPGKFIKGMIDQADHIIIVIAEKDKQAMAGIHPAKIMARQNAFKPYKDWRFEKEYKGKFTWVIGLYGTPAMAAEAGLSEKEYWQQIIKACFLDESDAVKKWRQVSTKIEWTKDRLNSLPIEKLHVLGPDADLWLSLGERRKWAGGGGRNIPSFEVFTSPDWRGTTGWIKFNQPLYHYGHLIEGIELEFKNGIVVKSRAKKNHDVIKHMLRAPNGNKVGEFSLTDGRLSHITRFMAETLFDENMGGPQGNTHIALGSSYRDCYDGDPGRVKKSQWEKLGFNDSAVHTDIISTAPRTVTAYLKGGGQTVIYKNGQFTI